MKSALSPKTSEELSSLLNSTAHVFNMKPELRRRMEGTQGWVNAVVEFKALDYNDKSAR
jgi:hypothetical protein